MYKIFLIILYIAVYFNLTSGSLENDGGDGDKNGSENLKYPLNRIKLFLDDDEDFDYCFKCRVKTTKMYGHEIIIVGESHYREPFVSITRWLMNQAQLGRLYLFSEVADNNDNKTYYRNLKWIHSGKLVPTKFSTMNALTISKYYFGLTDIITHSLGVCVLGKLRLLGLSSLNHFDLRQRITVLLLDDLYLRSLLFKSPAVVSEEMMDLFDFYDGIHDLKKTSHDDNKNNNRNNEVDDNDGSNRIGDGNDGSNGTDGDNDKCRDDKENDDNNNNDYSNDDDDNHYLSRLKKLYYIDNCQLRNMKIWNDRSYWIRLFESLGLELINHLPQTLTNDTVEIIKDILNGSFYFVESFGQEFVISYRDKIFAASLENKIKNSKWNFEKNKPIVVIVGNSHVPGLLQLISK